MRKPMCSVGIGLRWARRTGHGTKCGDVRVSERNSTGAMSSAGRGRGKYMLLIPGEISQVNVLRRAVG